ncbi:serine hydrolase [Streptomyces sp. NPDC102406]|uniref:serine hydrolase n=1 Tax=Streptomyces sp. NPDC102406 TaxID=3366171 RepID=UPI0037FB840E
MPLSSRPRRSRTALVPLLGACLMGACLAGAADPAGAAQRGPVCRAPAKPALAKQLTRDLRAALAGRRGTVSLALYDSRTRATCTLSAGRRYESASLVKVLTMEATLLRAEEHHRPLTPWERRDIRPMIRSSDNAAASRLWNDLGHPYLAATLRRAGATRTSLGPYSHWGLTRTTAADQLRLLAALTGRRSFLGPGSRAYGLRLMGEVREDQRWGVSAGMPRGLRAHLKNGWLPRATHGWRVHSIGVFTGGGRAYRIAVLSHDNPSMAYGVRTVERVARAVHRRLNNGRRGALGLTPAAEISGRPDGSAPSSVPAPPGPPGASRAGAP